MLRLKDITKHYYVADTTVEALQNLSLSFRENEFVSVLGPSGCGKTTLLNIIGGLDKYTKGDLFIAGRSTKDFKDKDWDVYRNHRIGFIFQSYNLIPHQTVLGNVELALTIAGLGKAERTEKAKRALDRVGLKEQYYKRPNQLSGGQSQRVAIARALVNDPDILLADEPTGALDTVTSVQIMDLIREIAEEKLVIMVTHNPDLAAKYSTRIIELLDGRLQSDSNPFAPEEEIKETEARKKAAGTQKKQRAKMSFFTSLRLSLNNLWSKKTRTIMTSVAGSIGIIGVSLVLSISFGVQSFITNMQNDMLSGNPIQIKKTGMDMSALMQGASWMEKAEALKEEGYVNVDSLIQNLASRSKTADSLITNNDITQEYIDYVLSLPKEYAASIFLDYGMDATNNVFTDFKTDKNAAGENMSLTAIRTVYTAVLEASPYADFSAYISAFTDIFNQAPDSEDYLLTQYDLPYGRVAKEKNEIMLVLGSDRMMTDLLLAQLGYYTQEEFLNIVYKAFPDEGTDSNPLHDPILDKMRFSYEELLGRSFVWCPNDDLFSATDNPYAPFTYNAYYNADSFSKGEKLTVVGILEPKEDISYGSLESGVYYTEALTQHMLAENGNSKIVTALKSSGKDSIPSGMQTVTLPDGTVSSAPIGVTFDFSFTFEGKTHEKQTGFVGNTSTFSLMAGSMMGGGDNGFASMKTLTLQHLGGVDMAASISVFPVDFELKDNVLKHLDRWNEGGSLTFYSQTEGKDITLAADQRAHIVYTDNLTLVINMINNMINIITFALVGFTSLALLVSCVMIGIITYVSVVERIKEIGIIRSLGGRKKDVSNLFTAETFMIGLASGLIGVGFTYLASLGINALVSHFADISAISIFPVHYALIMIGASILLTLVSGLMPSRSAAKKDPVVALRTE